MEKRRVKSARYNTTFIKTSHVLEEDVDQNKYPTHLIYLDHNFLLLITYAPGLSHDTCSTCHVVYVMKCMFLVPG